MRYLDRLQPLGLLVLRVVLGIILIAHGYPKVFGGMSHHLESVARIGLPAWMGYLSAGTEFFGGILILLGLFARCASIAVLIEMCVVIAKIHWKYGLNAQGGYEFPLALAAMAFTLICFGAGPIAMDAIRGHGRSRTKSGSRG